MADDRKFDSRATEKPACSRSAGHGVAPQDAPSVAALRALLLDFGLSQSEFALRINTDERTVAYWLQGVHSIRLRTLERDPELAQRFAWFWLGELSSR